ncbi:MAG: DUF2115 family protein [Lachnospiraceae bacterium]|nr:DUF2115 family protein [Lachnospiraceae bacterium]
MLKSELVEEIVDSIDDDTWDELDEDELDVTISIWNRRLLLQLWEGYGVFNGEVDDDEVEELKEAVAEYLAREWPEEPDAHIFVIQSCLALKFLYNRPLHPQEIVHYQTFIEDGKARYFCPQRGKEAEGLCRYCCAEPIDELTAKREAQIAELAEKEGPKTALILKEAFAAGIQNAGVVTSDRLEFYEKVRRLCDRSACRFQGTTWACPPAVGTLDECREKVAPYEKMLLISTPFLLSDLLDFRELDYTSRDFHVITQDLGARLRPLLGDFFMMSNESCIECEKCTYPNAPCRYPERLQPSIEGFGFLVAELAKKAGIPYTNGQSTSTYFGAVFYNEEGK